MASESEAIRLSRPGGHLHRGGPAQISRLAGTAGHRLDAADAQRPLGARRGRRRRLRRRRRPDRELGRRRCAGHDRCADRTRSPPDHRRGARARALRAGREAGNLPGGGHLLRLPSSRRGPGADLHVRELPHRRLHSDILDGRGRPRSGQRRRRSCGSRLPGAGSRTLWPQGRRRRHRRPSGCRDPLRRRHPSGPHPGPHRGRQDHRRGRAAFGPGRFAARTARTVLQPRHQHVPHRVPPHRQRAGPLPVLHRPARPHPRIPDGRSAAGRPPSGAQTVLPRQLPERRR